MDKEKVVVTLLLITIILSLVSVIVTVSIGGDDNVDSGNRLAFADSSDESGSVALVVNSPQGGTG